MTQVLLLRHGHVEGIVPRRFRGQLDLPLSGEGLAQATRAAAFVARHYRPVAVYSSPLQRCVDSARPLVARLSLPPPQVSPGLTDISYGLWQGRLESEVATAEPERYTLWQQTPERMVFPEGESLALLAGRALAALRTLADAHDGQTVAVFTHDSVIRVLLLTALGTTLSAYHRVCVDPCSLTELDCSTSAATRVVHVNERTGDG